MKRQDKIVLLTAIGVWVAAWTVIAVFKYLNGGYNGLDLAIYNNVFWNTAHGNLFASSIHAPSYLGDHAEWFILPLALIYRLFPHALTLVILQILALAASAVPVYLIAKKILNNRYALIFPLVWLLNFTVCYNAIWEFHFLVFSLPLILFASYFFIVKKFWPFIIFLFASLLVREDVALAAAGFSLVGLAEKDFWRLGQKKNIFLWALVPIALGAIVFLADYKIITAFNPQHLYKYLHYFPGAGGLIPFAAKIFSLATLQTIVAILIPFLFLPLRRPRWLLLSLPFFFMVTAAGSGDWFLPLQTHYLVPALPGLVIAAIYGFAALMNGRRAIVPKPLLAPFVIFAPLFSLIALGPIQGVPLAFAATDDARAEKEAVKMIPPEASVASAFAPATALSGREKFYYFNYAWFGKNEFAYADYAFPELPDYLLVNERFFLAYALGLNKTDPDGALARDGDDRFGGIIDSGNYGIVFARDGVALLKQGASGKYPFYNILAKTPPLATYKKRPAPGLSFIDETRTSAGWNLYFRAEAELPRDLVIKINGEILPFGQGLWPPDKLTPGSVIEYAYTGTAEKIRFSFFRGTGALRLLRDNAARFVFDELVPLGEEISLP